MQAIDTLLNRSSAIALSEPGPSAAQMDVILAAGQAAPDHGRLQPWRFIILEGKARAVLADTMGALRRAKAPDSDEAALAKERAKAYRAPTIIAIAATITPGKIPEIEQVMAVAAATQNMFLAAFAQGLGAMWKTGGAAYDPALKAALGLSAQDHIVAFLYLGTDSGARPAATRRPKDVVTRLPV